jgi:hypothetical protein
VTSAFIVGSKKSTASNPTPLHAARGFSYENDDDVYFFVHFSEPIVVSGTPTLTMKTGSHFENGAVHGTALFIGGGVGEKSTFWKNENGIYFASRAGGVYTDKYAVHDGGCTLGNAQLDGSLASDCVFYSNDGVSCDCSVYSGITHLADAQVRCVLGLGTQIPPPRFTEAGDCFPYIAIYKTDFFFPFSGRGGCTTLWRGTSLR